MSFPSIILFGDSLTEQSFSPEKRGFGASLSNTYARRADVLNRGLSHPENTQKKTKWENHHSGLSGYNSEWLLPWLQQILAAQVSEVLLWVIWVGANDACLPDFVYHVRTHPPDPDGFLAHTKPLFLLEIIARRTNSGGRFRFRSTRKTSGR